MRKASTCWLTCGKDVVRRRCRGKGSLQRRGVSSCVQWKVNGTLPSALFSISMHSSHWLADKVQRSSDCFFFPEPPGGVVPRGWGGVVSVSARSPGPRAPRSGAFGTGSAHCPYTPWQPGLAYQGKSRLDSQRVPIHESQAGVLLSDNCHMWTFKSPA